MIKLYDYHLSGNCYKIRLLLAFLHLECELVTVDLKTREQKSPEFLRLNELGQVPVLQDDELVVRDSHAILVYLARRYGGDSWLPIDPVGLSKITQWLSNAANEIANGLATARVHYLFNRTDIDIENATAKAHALLYVLNKHLQTRVWLEMERPTIADVACFPYVALAHEGKISLQNYPLVEDWIERFKQLPGFINMAGIA